MTDHQVLRLFFKNESEKIVEKERKHLANPYWSRYEPSFHNRFLSTANCNFDMDWNYGLDSETDIIEFIKLARTGNLTALCMLKNDLDPLKWRQCVIDDIVGWCPSSREQCDGRLQIIKELFNDDRAKKLLGCNFLNTIRHKIKTYGNFFGHEDIERIFFEYNTKSSILEELFKNILNDGLKSKSELGDMFDGFNMMNAETLKNIVVECLN
jgi:hypothetical protein